MRIALLIATTILIALPAFAIQPVAVWTVDGAEGMRLVDTVEDGRCDRVNLEGKQCARLREGTTPASNYLYFALTPEARAKVGADAYVVAELASEGFHNVVVQYNSAQDLYRSGASIFLTGGNKWEKCAVRLAETKLAGLQNGEADFRLACMFGPVSIARLEVYAEKPDIRIPSDKERIMKVVGKNPGPKGMYYTFGGEVDEANALLWKSLGVTSVESYVTWESCEREAEGKWDWSHWDRTVKILQDNDLKWVPFIIVSPAYSTPNWFRASNQHFPCRCLEHGVASKIESLWNPHLPKWIDRFIGEFAERYRDTGVIESVLLGIQGDFGEAIYSVWGGGWTFNVPGEYHNHAGYWCDDPYARIDFRKFVEKRYKTADAVNKAWGTEYKSLKDVDFPGRKDELAAFEKKVANDDPQVRRRWLDFIEWYRAAMTDWSDWWMATTRKHFPQTPIYLCTGGDAEPHHGSNFAEQCRVSAKHGAGVRITNEASDYAANFAITRWVAAAGKHYGVYYGFEPAGAEDERGIVARIYNATASGANQLHDYTPNVTSSKPRMDAQQAHLKYLFRVDEPIVPVALWYPNVALTLKWGGYIGNAAELRDYTDYDYVDETMLRTGALGRYKVLLVIQGEVMETSDAKLIADWAKKGGRVIVMDVDRFESVEGTPEPDEMLAGAVRVKGWDGLASQLRKDLTDLGLPVYDLAKDGIFGTQIARHRFLFLNTTGKETTLTIERGDKKHEAAIKAGTITDVRIK